MAGSILLQPEFFVEASYDSNLFYQAPGELAADESLTSAWLMVPGASLKASTPEPKDMMLNASARLAGEVYLSSSDTVLGQSGFDFTTDAAITLNRLGMVSWQPSIYYKRSNSPQYTANDESYNDHLIRLGLEANIQPEGGHVFSSKLGYNLQLYFLEQFSDFDRQTHALYSHTRWNFLFQTALLLNIDWQLVNYSTPEPSPQTSNVDSATIYNLTNVNSSPLRISTGISSLLFGRLDFRLLAGYAYTFYDSGVNDHLLLMHASIGYEWLDKSKTRLGYTKDFLDTTFGNYYAFHRVFLEWNKPFFDSRLDTSLRASLDFRGYSGVEGLDARDDLAVDLTASIDWRFVDAFKAGARYQVTTLSTDFGVDVPGATGATTRTLAEYTKHLVFLTAVYMF